jgi:hypothetical protein
MQKGNRLQIPKYVRWGYKLETTQILKATIQVVNGYGLSQTFLNKTRQRQKNNNTQTNKTTTNPKTNWQPRLFLYKKYIRLFSDGKTTNKV